MIEQTLGYIGRPFLQFYNSCERFGAFLIFQIGLLARFTALFSRKRLLFTQIDIIGFGSLGVVFLTALFTGMVEAVQLYDGFHKYGVENFMGYTIFVSITKELGPVFATLMVISRSISAMSAELGTMRVSEQIDAMDILGVDSKRYLLIPRIAATIFSLPLLVLWFDVVAISSAYFISVYALGVNAVAYSDTLMQLGEVSDIMSGLIKALVFGYIISAIGSYMGYHASGGARGVGQATIYGVVYSAIAIFIVNYFLSAFFLIIGL